MRAIANAYTTHLRISGSSAAAAACTAGAAPKLRIVQVPSCLTPVCQPTRSPSFPLTYTLLSQSAGESAKDSSSSAAEGVDTKACDNETEGSNSTTASKKSEPVGDPVPQGSSILWRAKPLTKEFEGADTWLGYSAAITGGGLGLGLLGIAPFSPPGPFMIGLMLATVQVRLGHVWLTRQLRAQARRHVTEMESEQAGEGEPWTLKLQFDGGLSRTLRLSHEESERGSHLAELLQQGRGATFLDRTRGQSETPEALKKVLDSRCTIVSEDFEVKPFPDESQEEANKFVRPLLDTERSPLQGLEGGDDAAPLASMTRIQRNSNMLAVVIVASGAIVCASGRYAAAHAEHA